MTVAVIIPHALTENKLKGRKAKADKYGCQPYSELEMWLCFRDDVEAWIEKNCKRKSGIRLRENPGPPEIPKWGESRSAWRSISKHGYVVYFDNEKDGILFKLKWIG